MKFAELEVGGMFRLPDYPGEWFIKSKPDNAIITYSSCHQMIGNPIDIEMYEEIIEVEFVFKDKEASE